MRIAFCGTPQFAVPALKLLAAPSDFEVVAVITQPDRPRGRGQEVSCSPVKEAALAANIPVYQPEKIRAPEIEQLLQKLALDCIVIIAYGQIIPARLLPIPKLGWINLHASLLPKYRGAAPINWAILRGDSMTGVTTMRIDAGMDTGDMLLQREISIGPAETAPELVARMSNLGAPLMLETLRGLESQSILPIKQEDSEATYAPMLTKEHGRIEWTGAAKDIFNQMRGLAPWPGAYTEFRGQTCHLWGEPVSNEKSAVVPGTIFDKGGEWRVACGGTTVLRLTAVKLAGRNKISSAEFANGARLKSGETFGGS